MKTKDRILNVALNLFNEQGTGAVSTNHIAEAAGISPGNLYYHYANKEAIISALFEQQFARTDVAFSLPDDRLPTLEDIQAWIQVNFEILWEYRFIYRELIVLLRQDTALHSRYQVIRERGYEGFHEIINALMQAGVLVNITAETAARLADLSWLISEFWLAEVEVSGETITPDQMQRGIELMMQVFQPYIPR